jgi:DUF1009 family protein
MGRSGVTALAIDAERTLLFDRARLMEAAEAAGLSVQAFPVASPQDEGAKP